MNKLFLFALLAVGAEAAQAQSIAAGTVSLGGSIGYSITTLTQGTGSNNREVTGSQFAFSPTFGYFIADNVAAGLNLGLVSTTPLHDTSGSGDPDAEVSLRVGPFVQYYKMLSEQFGLTGALSAGYQRLSSTQNDPYGPPSAKATGSYAELTPGLVFFPIPKFGISASIGGLGYSRIKNDTAPGAPSGYEDKATTFGLSFGLDQLLFGGTFYFGR